MDTYLRDDIESLKKKAEFLEQEIKIYADGLVTTNKLRTTEMKFEHAGWDFLNSKIEAFVFLVIGWVGLMLLMISYTAGGEPSWIAFAAGGFSISWGLCKYWFAIRDFKVIRDTVLSEMKSINL